MAARSRPIWTAPSSASCRGSSPRPSSSWNRCSTTCRSASPPRTSRTAATSSPTAPLSASRGFSRDHIVGKNAPRDLQRRHRRRASRRPTAPRSHAPEGQYRNEFEVERGAGDQRMVASIRIVARNEKQQAGIPDRAVRGHHRPPLAVAGAGEHQEVPRARGRQHPGRADRGAGQGRPLSARQPQRRDDPQPPPRGSHRPDRRRHLQSEGSQADHRARRGRDQEARDDHRGASDLHQGRPAAVPDPPRHRARRCRRAAISDQDPRGRHRPPADRVADGAHGLSRRPHRPAEPRRLPAGADPDDRGLRGHRRGIRGAVRRSRRPEGSQRRVRPCDSATSC